MSGIATLGTTYNLPNYHGELLAISPEDTPFTTAIGGLTGGEAVSAGQFEWQTYDLRDAANDRQRLEGADAPTVDNRVRANVTNVVEIHQEQVSVSYSKQASTQQYAGANIGGSDNPVTNELDFQLTAALKAKKAARDALAEAVAALLGEDVEIVLEAEGRDQHGVGFVVEEAHGHDQDHRHQEEQQEDQRHRRGEEIGREAGTTRPPRRRGEYPEETRRRPPAR